MARQPPATPAEVSILPSLGNCLVNLPQILAAALDAANAIAQNVVVEITFQDSSPALLGSGAMAGPLTRSVYAGWTGMVSQQRANPMMGPDGISRSLGRRPDASLVEVDSAFARLVGLSEAQKIVVTLHMNPPLVDVINIEPITPADWEMIELRAQYLEENFLLQIRAIPNPVFESTSRNKDTSIKVLPHPISLHLSPTSTANVRVTSISPSLGPNVAFAKISPGAEVIVAPKARQKPAKTKDARSTTSRRSVKSTASAKPPRPREDVVSAGPVFLRALDSTRVNIDVTASVADSQKAIYAIHVLVDPEVLQSHQLQNTNWVTISLALPTNLLDKNAAQKDSELDNPATKVVAEAVPWASAPSPNYCALSPMLCQVLAMQGAIGDLVRIEGAPPSVPKPSLLKGSRDGAVKMIKVSPFSSAASSTAAQGLRFGGDSKQEREEASENLKTLFGKGLLIGSFFDGPITDGMIIPAQPAPRGGVGWPGGLIRFEPPPSADQVNGGVAWFLGTDRRFSIDVHGEAAVPSSKLSLYTPCERLPAKPPRVMAVDDLVEKVYQHLSFSSSVLLAGGIGSGKTEISRLVAYQLQRQELFYVVYISCKKLVSDESRVSTIKEALERAFGFAAWGTRVDGKALVVLDDLDKLTPAETELQVGNDNERSRHISETLYALTKRYCGFNGTVTLLATAHSKEALNSVVVGGHVVDEIIPLKAPNKDGRRRILEDLASREPVEEDEGEGDENEDSADESRRSEQGEEVKGRFSIDPSVDLLDTAGQTDGYMPGDLVLLTSRARNEAMIRAITADAFDTEIATLTLASEDFSAALRGLVPASLRNVSLQKSDVKWNSIGGLSETKSVLLETLQYPTTYAPIFAACPLRLRSGLLLYGYPGCGKTLLASAVASESGLNFISVKGPEILNKYIGASEKGVRDLFERAEAARPCVLFFDEFDSIAPKRGHDSTGVTDRVVNQLLTLMDGAEGLSGVYVLAATSRPDLIDSALLRPGRLDKSLLCDMPNFDDRLDILRALSTNMKFGDDVWPTGAAIQDTRLAEVAGRTDGYSGADLRAVIQNAQLDAIHEFLETDEPKEERQQTNSSGVEGASSFASDYPEFTFWKYGEGAASRELPADLERARLAERTVIAAKIRSVKEEQERIREAQRQQQRSLFGGGGSHSAFLGKHGRSVSMSSTTMNGLNEDLSQLAVGPGGEGGDESKQPKVCWRHFESSLAGSRPSINGPERARFDAIYKQFVAGRDGDLPDGQAGNEIGGRTTLM